MADVDNLFLEKKVFIAGCGRSGTTYLRVLLDEHPEIFMPIESLFILDYLKMDTSTNKTFLKWFLFKEPFLKVWYSGKPFNFSSVPEAISKIHLYEMTNKAALIWGQKTPRFIRHFDLFNKSFNNINWILIYRDPRAVVSSLLRSKLHPYRISAACKRWKRDNELIIQLMNSKENDNVFILKYEDLILNFNQKMEKILKFIDVSPFNFNNLFCLNITPEQITGSSYSTETIRDGLMPQEKNINNWRNELTNQQIAYIQYTCQEEMKFLGYKQVEEIKFKHSKLFHFDLIGWVKEPYFLFENLIRFPGYTFYYFFRKFTFSCLKTFRKVNFFK